MNIVVKSVALKLISLGLKLPSQINRFNELTHLETLLEALDINCVLDVGANRGQFANELRKIGYTGYIISFEPLRSEFELLSKSFSKDTNWSGHQIALGSVNKSAQINVAKLTGLSSLLESTDNHMFESSTKQFVEIKRLDNIFSLITEKISNPRVFLKMDTQGYDLEVFKGAKHCLEHIRGLQSELSVQPFYKNMPHYNEALSVYEQAGFELCNLSIVNCTLSGSIMELNAFMSRSGCLKI